jgi:hypothetical protein
LAEWRRGCLSECWPDVAVLIPESVAEDHRPVPSGIFAIAGSCGTAGAHLKKLRRARRMRRTVVPATRVASGNRSVTNVRPLPLWLPPLRTCRQLWQLHLNREGQFAGSSWEFRLGPGRIRTCDLGIKSPARTRSFRWISSWAVSAAGATQAHWRNHWRRGLRNGLAIGIFARLQNR